MQIYLILINAAGLVFMLCDKIFAKKHLYRIPEAVLFLLAALGGSAGILLGMLLFRHKIRKARFRYGIPLLLALQITGYCLLK